MNEEKLASEKEYEAETPMLQENNWVVRIARPGPPTQDEANGYNGDAEGKLEGHNTNLAEETNGTPQYQVDKRELKSAEIITISFRPLHTIFVIRYLEVKNLQQGNRRPRGNRLQPESG